MQAPNAQGLGGLASRPQQIPQQQQQAMPSPQSGSPMAGLGSVQERVNAYRGNAAPLQQRYAVSQDLLDLLALQKIKSEKEAAARQMQLQMGQQQAAQGAEPMTVAQQREKEVMDLTKNELAQQRGETAQQQMSEQQQAMQRMMGGIANAPGAATAAQPKMMASGGIVAFADGGMPEDEEQTSPAGRAARKVLAPFMPGDEERGRLREQIKAKYIGRAGLGGLFTPQSDAQRAQAQQIMSQLDRMSTAEMRALLEQPAGAGRGMVNPPFDPNAPMTPPQAVPTPTPGAMPGAQGAAPTPRPTPTPRPAPAGLAGLPGAQGAAPTPATPGTIPGAAPAASGLESEVTKAISGGLGIDSLAGGEAYGKSVQERLMFPEEQERRRKTIEEQRKLYEQEFDPERQRREKLQRFLLGAGGRRYGEFAGGAGAALAYETSQHGAQRERLKGLEDMEQGLFSLRQGATEKGVASGMERMKALQQEKTSATTAGVQQLGTEERARTATLDRDARAQENALNRQIEQAKIRISQDRNQIDKGVMDYTRLQNSKVDYEKLINETATFIDKKYKPMRDALAMTLGSSDPEKKKQAQQQLRDIEIQQDAEVATKTKELREEVRKLSAMQLGDGKGGYSATGMPRGFERAGERPAR
jgi:hypothetical protein